MKKRRDARVPGVKTPGGVVLAFDGGGTRTRCAAVSRGGRILGLGRAGPTNVVLCPERDLRRNLAAAARAALADAGLDLASVHSMGAGLAGVFHDGRNRETAIRILRGLSRRARVTVTGDAVIALRGAIPEGHGVVAVSGTGSSVFGMSIDSGRWAKAGGGGPILGDEGSGYGLVLDALRAAWRSCDGRDEPSALAPRFARALGLRRFADAPDAVYAKSMTRDRLAALAVVVSEAADRGDRAALDVMRRAGSDLGHAVAATIRTLDMKGRCIVSHHGAVFEGSAPFLDAFRDTVRASCPDAEILPPVLPPLGGAFLVGLEALGEKATGEHLETFMQGVRDRLTPAAGR